MFPAAAAAAADDDDDDDDDEISITMLSDYAIANNDVIFGRRSLLVHLMWTFDFLPESKTSLPFSAHFSRVHVL